MKSDVEHWEHNYPLCCREPPIDFFLFFSLSENYQEPGEFK